MNGHVLASVAPTPMLSAQFEELATLDPTQARALIGGVFSRIGSALTVFSRIGSDRHGSR
jgi:hypothetical protein